MKTTLDRLKEELKIIHGMSFMEYTYRVVMQDDHIEIWYEHGNYKGILCRVYSQFIEVINPVTIPHKISVLIAKALRAPSGTYKKPNKGSL